MKKGFLTSILLLLLVSVNCQNLTFQEHGARAFFQLNYPNESLDTKILLTDTILEYKDLSIVNFSSPRGFVMVRDSDGENEVVAYSFSNNFSFDADTSGVIEKWIDVISTSTEIPGYNPYEKIPRLKTEMLVVEPLCQTNWGQKWPYNYYCPVDQEEGQRTVVGCVAVAVGQIIRYFDQWNNFQIQYSYQHGLYGNLSCSAGQYDWTSMENHPLGINHEVARLLYHSGVLVDMDYGVDGSGADSFKAASLFGSIYDGGHLNPDPYGSEDAFYKSISQYKPIYTTYEGHAFVCDGFDGSSFYHFNMGWGGIDNGYYPLSSVVGESLVSAIFHTSPEDSLKPPGFLKKRIVSDTEVEISWRGPEGDRTGLLAYNIYLDDIYYGETQDTILLHDCQPGSHYLRISAKYSNGESRWIGPASYFSHNDPLTIADDKLRLAMNTSIGIPSSDRQTHMPTKGEMYDIRSLQITNAADLSGIENCVKLSRLSLLSTRTGDLLDVSPLEGCPEITFLKVSRYQLENPQAIGGLTNLQELRLNENGLNSLDFLSSLKDLFKLEVIGNQLADIGFLNDLDRLSWIALKECNIASFDLLENTYGVEYLDISNNAVSDIEWLNGNRTLRYLDASQNQLAGALNLDGFTKLSTLFLSNNQISNLSVTNSPKIEEIDLKENQIVDIQNIIEENDVLNELDVSKNMVQVIPSVENKIVKLNLGDNKLYDLVPLDNYSKLVDLDLQGNRITDVSRLVYKDYCSRLQRLNLRNNPLSKESFLEYKMQISAAAGSVYFPSRFDPASPCYLKPCNDSVMMTHTIELIWEGDYENKGYQYDVFMQYEEEEFLQIATGLNDRSFEKEVENSGNYTWYTVAHLDADSLISGYGNFKVFSGFAIPFFEDFEIYNPNQQLCIQSPFWRIFGEDQSTNRDGYVVDIRSYEGDQSIKIAGSTDLLFPISEYLTGFCDVNFQMMVDRNRQSTIQTLLSDGTSLYFYFYSEEICEVYHDQTRIKFITYKARNWMEMEIISDEDQGLKWLIDNNLIHSIDLPQAIEGIRFNSADGPGYYESAPTVFYLDNYAIESGTTLSAPNILSGNKLSGSLYFSGHDIILQNPLNQLQRVDLYDISGRLLKSTVVNNHFDSPVKIPFDSNESVIIVVLYDKYYNRIVRKILTYRP